MGHVIGISKYCDHSRTYKALYAKNRKVVHRSLLCPAAPDDINMRAELLGGSRFLIDAQLDGNEFRARIVIMIEDHNYKLEPTRTGLIYFCSVNKDSSKEFITYNQLLDYLAKDDNKDVIWKFKCIT
jgi:hypothetical protein